MHIQEPVNLSSGILVIVMKKSVYQQIDVFTVKRGYIYSFFFLNWPCSII